MKHIWTVNPENPTEVWFGENEDAETGCDVWFRGSSEQKATGQAKLLSFAPEMRDALKMVADMTYCGQDAEWHFKPGYDPQIVLDVLSRVEDYEL